MQTVAKLYQDEGLSGQIASPEPETERMRTGYTGQVTRLTIGNAPYVETVYHVLVDVISGYTPQFDYDGTGDADAIAAGAGMTAAWNNDPVFVQLGTMTDNGDGTVDIAWKDYSRTWNVTLSTDDAATFTAAVQTAASSVTARFGRLVIRGAATADPREARLVAPLGAATPASALRGVVAREDAGVEQPSLEYSPTDFSFYPPGRAVPVVNRGWIWTDCQTAMTVDGPIFAQRTAGTWNGAVRNDADGGNAVDISSIARVEVGGAAGRTCKIKINIPL